MDPDLLGERQIVAEVSTGVRELELETIPAEI
jgi:hypothetical protein